MSDIDWADAIQSKVKQFQERQKRIQKTLWNHSEGIWKERGEAALESFAYHVAKSHRPNIHIKKKPEFEKIEKMRRAAAKILESPEGINILLANGMDPEFQITMARFAYCDLYQNGPPKAGRKAEIHWLDVAKAFLEIYPLVTGRGAGTNEDHNFVMVLGQIFKDLEGEAASGISAQHYARQAVALAKKKMP